MKKNLEGYTLEELQKMQYDLQDLINEKVLNEIENHVTIEKIEDPIKRNVKLPPLNKNSSLYDYMNQIDNGEYDLIDSKASKKVIFTDFNILTNFSQRLLSDYTFLENTGGTSSDDSRLEGYENIWDIPQEIIKTVEWYLNNTVEIYYNEVYQFTVDSQGYKYARYVGI